MEQSPIHLLQSAKRHFQDCHIGIIMIWKIMYANEAGDEDRMDTVGHILNELG